MQRDKYHNLWRYECSSKQLVFKINTYINAFGQELYVKLSGISATIYGETDETDHLLFVGYDGSMNDYFQQGLCYTYSYQEVWCYSCIPASQWLNNVSSR